MLALLTVIAGSLVYSSRTDLQIEGNFASQARAEAAADAGVYKAVFELSTPPAIDSMSWRGNGLTHPWQFADAMLEVTVFDESAKIDLNSAPEALLQGMFRSLGRSDEDAAALTDAIIDWRDADDLKRPHGAEKDDYAAAGRSYGPANAPFEAIEELRQVLGMDEQLFLQVEPLITVHSGQAGVNTLSAPRQVLLAIPGTTPEEVDAYIEQRSAALQQQLPVPPFALAQGFQSGIVGSVFGIQVKAELSDNTRFFREAVVRLGGGSSATVLAWRKPMVSFSNPAAGAPGIQTR